MLHNSGTAVIQTSHLCCAKQNSNIISAGLCQHRRVRKIILLYGICSQGASVKAKFRTTLAQHLNQSRASAVLQLNLISIKFSTAEAQLLNWTLVTLQYMMIVEAPRRMISYQAPVVPRVENAIHPINSMPCEANALLQTFVCSIGIYPLKSNIHPLINWAQINKIYGIIQQVWIKC